MSIELRVGDVIAWASGGECGHVVLQLHSESAAQGNASSLTSTTGISIVSDLDPQENRDSISIDYPMGDTLDRILSQQNNMTEDVRQAIHRAIWNISFRALFRRRGGDESNDDHTQVAQFNSRRALEEVLGHLGVENIPRKNATEYKGKDLPGISRPAVIDRYTWKEFFSIDPADQVIIASTCRCSDCDGNPENYTTCLGCLRRVTGQLVRGFVPIALALMHCSFDPTKLRLREVYLYGRHSTQWSQYVLETDGTAVLDRSYLEALMFHIYPTLIGSGENPTVLPDWRVIGCSGGAFTVCYTFVLQQDAYDDYGRFLSIIHGQVSMGRVLRSTIEESGRHRGRSNRQLPNDQFQSAVARGSYLDPHYHPADVKYEISANLEEHTIFFETVLLKSGEPVLKPSLTRCVKVLTEEWDIPRCDHGRDVPYRVPEGRRIFVVESSPFFADVREGGESAGVYVFASRGKKVEQVILCGMLRERFETRVFQLYACLKCCVRFALTKEGSSCIVMGG